MNHGARSRSSPVCAGGSSWATVLRQNPHPPSQISRCCTGLWLRITSEQTDQGLPNPQQPVCLLCLVHHHSDLCDPLVDCTLVVRRCVCDSAQLNRPP